jgi:hypothetical protein
MTKANEYTVKRIDEDTFELWHDDKHLATLTKEEAWPVMIGQVHPNIIVRQQVENTITPRERGKEE